MRVVIAMMKHETNTFSPVQTPIERFALGQNMPFHGDEVLAPFKAQSNLHRIRSSVIIEF